VGIYDILGTDYGTSLVYSITNGECIDHFVRRIYGVHDFLGYPWVSGG
jgi:hypothetical protein